MTDLGGYTVATSLYDRKGGSGVTELGNSPERAIGKSRQPDKGKEATMRLQKPMNRSHCLSWVNDSAWGDHGKDLDLTGMREADGVAGKLVQLSPMASIYIACSLSHVWVRALGLNHPRWVGKGDFPVLVDLMKLCLCGTSIPDICEVDEHAVAVSLEVSCAESGIALFLKILKKKKPPIVSICKARHL